MALTSNRRLTRSSLLRWTPVALAMVVITAGTVAASPLLRARGGESATLAGRPPRPAEVATAPERTAAKTSGKTPAVAPAGPLVPNELGRIPIVEWHQVVDRDGTYKVSRERFKAELAELHRRGYVPVSLADVLDKRIDIPAGKSPVLFTFDDASPSQFRYLERNGQLVIDPTSAVGILLDFIKAHPDWKPRGVFCMLPAAQAGHAFFGEKGIDGQKSEWRLQKVRFLHEQGFELCNHTLWHAKLNKYSDAVVQEQLARGVMAIDSAVPGYNVRGLALPYGLWPKNRALTRAGSWYDKRGKREVRYRHEAVFEVAGGPARSPFDPQFDAGKLPRVPLQGGTNLITTLNEMDKPGSKWARYVSDGNPKTIARP